MLAWKKLKLVALCSWLVACLRPVCPLAPVFQTPWSTSSKMRVGAEATDIAHVPAAECVGMCQKPRDLNEGGPHFESLGRLTASSICLAQFNYVSILLGQVALRFGSFQRRSPRTSCDQLTCEAPFPKLLSERARSYWGPPALAYTSLQLKFHILSKVCLNDQA